MTAAEVKNAKRARAISGARSRKIAAALRVVPSESSSSFPGPLAS